MMVYNLALLWLVPASSMMTQRHPEVLDEPSVKEVNKLRNEFREQVEELKTLLRQTTRSKHVRSADHTVETSANSIDCKPFKTDNKLELYYQCEKDNLARADAHDDAELKKSQPKVDEDDECQKVSSPLTWTNDKRAECCQTPGCYFNDHSKECHAGEQTGDSCA